MIEIENLSKNFGPVQALRDLTLRIPWGELFCFLGPNGAGKTTTLKILCGLLRPTSGTARVAGIDIAADPLAARALIGYIPDHPFLYERLTASEFLDFTGTLYGLPRYELEPRRRALMDTFGLADSADVLIRDLSHGFRQRLLYAATLLHDPKVLLIDEPLVGLDPYSIRLIKNLLREKARAGVTVFLTTHILALAEDIADRIGILDEGRLIAVGTQEELRQQAAVQGDLEEVFLKLTG